MVVAPVDMAILKSNELRTLYSQYTERFGEKFILFNYADFDRKGDKCAAQVYKETLEKALRDGKPYHIKSKRYDFFDH